MSRLRFSDVQARGRLDASTAQYVLKSGELPRMPKAGRQGFHRMFDNTQALRLAICTQLVMLGVPLRKAVSAVRFCERQVRATNPDLYKKALTFERDSFDEPWCLEIYDCHHLRVWCGELDGDYPARWQYLDLEADKIVTLRSLQQSLVYVEVNLTELEVMLRNSNT